MLSPATVRTCPRRASVITTGRRIIPFSSIFGQLLVPFRSEGVASSVSYNELLEPSPTESLLCDLGWPRMDPNLGRLLLGGVLLENSSFPIQFA
jgi:hypothetical protein